MAVASTASMRVRSLDVGPDETARAAHLLRRAGFGATTAEIEAAVARGYAETVEYLLTAPDPAADAVPDPAIARPPADLGNEAKVLEANVLATWWVQRMVVSTNPLREKLPFFWHSLFTSGMDKVQSAWLLWKQNLTMRQLGGGDFEALAYALTVDPAMLVWLDLVNSTKAAPNENYAREFMELFALGRLDANGAPNYTENDVKASARSLTGWVPNLFGFIDPDHQPLATFDASKWDNGTKTFLGQTGAWNTRDIVRIVTHHPSSAPWVTSRLWSFFAYPVGPGDPVVADLAPAFATDGNITNLLRTVFLHPAFQSEKARTGLVKSPVEYVIGALRALQIPANPMTASPLVQLEQVPFRPPNVAGWPQNAYWVTTASALDKVSLGQAAAFLGNTAIVDGAAPADRCAALATLLGLPGWSARTQAALERCRQEPKTMVALALVSPEYLLN